MDGAIAPSIFKEVNMRCYYIKIIYSINYGTTYKCNHPVYRECTLFKINNLGLAVIQQRNNPNDKTTYFGFIYP